MGYAHSAEDVTKMKLWKPQLRLRLKSSTLLGLMTMVCLAVLVTSFAIGVGTEPLRELAGRVIIPFETSVENLSVSFKETAQRFREKEEILLENESLKAQVESLTGENHKLLLQAENYEKLKRLVDLGEDYASLPKVAAQIIAKDPGNWYDVFVINKGSKDGIRVGNNVIAERGLVGIVTSVGSRWARVRAIIDDSSSVSAMTVSSQDNFVVHGDLELIDEGMLRFEQLYDQEDVVTTGERVVTSAISENYVEGLFIGYVNEVVQDSNNLTKTGTIVTPIDFAHLKYVYVITVNKQDLLDDTAPAVPEEGSASEDTSSEEYVEEEDYEEEVDYEEEEEWYEDYEEEVG